MLMFSYVALFCCCTWCIQLYSCVYASSVKSVPFEIDLFFLLRYLFCFDLLNAKSIAETSVLDQISDECGAHILILYSFSGLS
jgi:hypothetical protein